jgi:hypothetical protein
MHTPDCKYHCFYIALEACAKHQFAPKSSLGHPQVQKGACRLSGGYPDRLWVSPAMIWGCLQEPKLAPKHSDLVSMRGKHNTYVGFIASLVITHGTLMSPQCVQNAIHTFRTHNAEHIIPQTGPETWCPY